MGGSLGLLLITIILTGAGGGSGGFLLARTVCSDYSALRPSPAPIACVLSQKPLRRRRWWWGEGSRRPNRNRGRLYGKISPESMPRRRRRKRRRIRREKDGSMGQVCVTIGAELEISSDYGLGGRF